MNNYTTQNFLPASASRLLKPLADLFMRLRGQTVAIGLSGGADSAMLSVCAASLARKYHIQLHCLYIHHGLMREADVWQQHCNELVKQLNQLFVSPTLHTSAVIFSALAVQVDKHSGLGIEGAAREARYQAFFRYAQQHQIEHFLLAHHLNDQAETLLLRLLRGSGVRGMQGMQSESWRAIQVDDFVQTSEMVTEVSQREMGVYFHRPWLMLEREYILELAIWFEQQTQWAPVQDESNFDERYKRGVIRQYLNPVLHRFWPSWRQNLARHARLMQEAQQMMDDMATIDFQGLETQDQSHSFSLKAWRALPAYRQSNVLRYWLGLFNIAMPSDKRLQAWLKQLREVHQLGFDREVLLPHENYVISVKKGRVILEKSN